jgi:hypothetical protein
MTRRSRTWTITLVILPLAALTTGCCEWICPPGECAETTAGSGTGADPGQGAPGPMIVIRQDTSTSPPAEEVVFYNEDTGMNLAESGSVSTNLIDNELHGIKVKDFDCDVDMDSKAETWVGIDELIANDGTTEVRLKKTSNGLFWSYRTCCGAGAWSVLEPTEDAAYDYKVPVEFGDAKHSTLKGDGADCDRVALKVFKP